MAVVQQKTESSLNLRRYAREGGPIMQPFTPNKPQYPTQSYIDLSEHWANKAKDNLQTWGIQEPLTVLACMQEELGEIARAVLEGKATDALDETADLAALCFQMVEAIAHADD